MLIHTQRKLLNILREEGKIHCAECISFKQIDEHQGPAVNSPASYSGDPWLKARPGDQLL